MILGHVDKRRKAFAEPHGDLTVHVDSEGFESLLQATHCVVFKGAGVFTEVHPPDLRKSQTADWNKA